MNKEPNDEEPTFAKATVDKCDATKMNRIAEVCLHKISVGKLAAK